MRIGSRPILYALAFTILFGIFGWFIWHFLAAIVTAFVGWNCWRILWQRAGLRPRQRRKTAASIPAWIEAVSLARIALSFGGVTSKRERIPSGPVARYRLRPRRPGPSAQITDDDPRWNDPEFPFNV